MALSDNVKGALLMSAAMAGFTINDTFMKSLSDDMPLMQAIFLRGLLVSIVLGAAVVAMRTPVRMPRRDWSLVGLRTVAETVAAFLFLTAIFNAPLANMTAILQALPLTVTLAGAVFLGEPVGWKRLSAIIVGFVGVLLIVRPGMEGFDVYSLFALGAVVAVTFRELSTRRLSAAAPSLLVALIGSAGVMAAALVAMTGQSWSPLDADALVGLAGTSFFVLGAYVLSVSVMRVGDIGFVAPFRYTGLLWALVLGWVAFGDWPDTITLTGATIIMATGVFTLWRERRAARRAILTQTRPARIG